MQPSLEDLAKDGAAPEVKRRRAGHEQSRDYGSVNRFKKDPFYFELLYQSVHPSPMFYTYIPQSIENPDRHYIGFTSDLKQRLKEHNSGKCSHTSKHASWKIHCYFAFESEFTAKSFERYLKSGSGREFSKRHF